MFSQFEDFHISRGLRRTSPSSILASDFVQQERYLAVIYNGRLGNDQKGPFARVIWTWLDHSHPKVPFPVIIHKRQPANFGKKVPQFIYYTNYTLASAQLIIPCFIDSRRQYTRPPCGGEKSVVYTVWGGDKCHAKSKFVLKGKGAISINNSYVNQYLNSFCKEYFFS